MSDEAATEETKSEETKAPETSAPVFDMASFRESIEDEKLREHSERFNSPLEMAKANLESRKKLSKAVIPPSKNASDEEVAAYRKAMNVPESAEGYEYPAMPEGVEMPENVKKLRDKWSELFHKHNVPKNVVTEIINTYKGQMEGEVTGLNELSQQHLEKSRDTLKGEWKGDYDKNMLLSSATAKELLGDDYEEAKFIKLGDGTWAMDHPAFARVFARVGREMGEADFIVSVTDDQMADLHTQADDARAKMKEYKAKGDLKNAGVWDEKERQILDKIDKASKKGK